MKPPKTNTTTNKSGSKFMIIGLVLVFFGPSVLVLVVRTILILVLNHPAVNTTGLAVVNIGSLLTAFLSLVAGVSIGLIGVVRALRKK